MARPERARLARAGTGRRRAGDVRDRAGRLLPLPARHRASRHRARGHDDPRGLDAAPRRRRAARRPLRPPRARREQRGEARGEEKLSDPRRLHSVAFTTESETRAWLRLKARCERPRPRRRGRPQDRMGRPADAGAPGHSRALRAREAARRLPRLGLPARHHRDREPDAHPQGGRRRRRPVRVEPAVHAGRRRGSARRCLRHRHLRDQGRGQRHVLLAPRGRDRPSAAHHDGRRRRRDRDPPLGEARAARRRDRRHRGDDDRRDPAEGARGRRQARLPRRRRQRGPHQAPLRQPLRHGPVDPRRDHPGHQRPARGPRVRRRRLRLVRTRRRDAREGHGRARDRDRGRSDAGDRGRDGRLPGDADARGGEDRRHHRHRDGRQVRRREAATSR